MSKPNGATKARDLRNLAMKAYIQRPIPITRSLFSSPHGKQSANEIPHGYYVSNAGSDSNDGLYPTNYGGTHGPWATIAKVNAQTFVAGDLVRFNRGDTFTDAVLELTNRSNLTIGNYGSGAIPIIDCQNVLLRGIHSTSGAVNLIIDGIEIKNATGDGMRLNGESAAPSSGNIIRNCISHNNGYHGFKFSEDIAYDGIDNSNILIENCTAYSNQQHGFQASNGAGNITYRNCIAHDNNLVGGTNANFRFGSVTTGLMEGCTSYNTYIGLAIEPSAGMTEHGSNIIIRNNLFYANTFIGINLFQITATNNYIYNNIIINNTGAGNTYGIDLNESTGQNIYNNTLYKNKTTNIRVQVGCTGNVIKNNISYAVTGGYALSIADSVPTTDYNDIYIESGNPINDNGTERTLAGYITAHAGQDSHSISSDPLFISSSDYHLQAGSPCIDAGVSLAGTVNNDYDGISRPQGIGYDIGAYER